MDVKQTLFSLGMMAVSAVAAYFLFRRNPRARLISRGPVFIVCFLVFFYVGLANLPLAAPGLFASALGHSVWDDYMLPPRMDGTQEGGTWWLVRWLDPIRMAYSYAVWVGIMWAIINLIRRRSWKWNAACLAIGALGFVAHIYLFVACFPFCI